MLFSGTSGAAGAVSRFAFAPIGIHTGSTVHVPEDYSWDVLALWGDPPFSDAPELDHAMGGNEASAERMFGENTDAMESLAEVLTVPARPDGR